ncbi:hypothetical protein [Serinicoccus sp. CUA-874]|uniref:hypothetical protein n=1 Tax=Serinicoccus sp. CUA-874 TaxID=1517939 RepID=UPI0016514700|nr:hypothetical protein [Serinicoccus sp. CUA-874]
MPAIWARAASLRTGRGGTTRTARRSGDGTDARHGQELGGALGDDLGEPVSVAGQFGVELAGAEGEAGRFGAGGRGAQRLDAPAPGGDLVDLDTGQSTAGVDAEVVGADQRGESVDRAESLGVELFTRRRQDL